MGPHFVEVNAISKKEKKVIGISPFTNVLQNILQDHENRFLGKGWIAKRSEKDVSSASTASLTMFHEQKQWNLIDFCL